MGLPNALDGHSYSFLKVNAALPSRIIFLSCLGIFARNLFSARPSS